MWWLVAGDGYDCWVETVRLRGRDSETERESGRERETVRSERERMKKIKIKKE